MATCWLQRQTIKQLKLCILSHKPATAALLSCNKAVGNYSYRLHCLWNNPSNTSRGVISGNYHLTTGPHRCNDVPEPLEEKLIKRMRRMFVQLWWHAELPFCVSPLGFTESSPDIDTHELNGCLVSMDFSSGWMHLFIQFTCLKTAEYISVYMRTYSIVDYITAEKTNILIKEPELRHPTAMTCVSFRSERMKPCNSGVPVPTFASDVGSR